MIRRRPNNRLFVATAIMALVLMACGTTSYLKVTYQLPGDATGPAAKTVHLEVIDGTGENAFLGPNVREDLKTFTGLFSLSVAGKHPEPVLEGAYDIQGLFDTAFRERLTAAGVQMVDKAADTVPTLRVKITAFRIDMAGRTWTARLDYTAGMWLGGTELTHQNVSGNAERAKIIGTGDAETLLGEIVTSLVNRLDLNALFEHPRL